jgi:hypothetical protein
MAIGVLWVLWLARESVSPVEPGARPSAALPLDGYTNGVAATQPRADSTRQEKTVPAISRLAEASPPGSDPRLRLAFQMPASTGVGEAFDLRVGIEARQSIARIVVEISYDPALLKARSLEEIDYAQRATGGRAFSIDELSDGRIVLAIRFGGSKPKQDERLDLPIAQFEALAPGSAQVRIVRVSISDASNQPVLWTATGQDIRIAIN